MTYTSSMKSRQRRSVRRWSLRAGCVSVALCAAAAIGGWSSEARACERYVSHTLTLQGVSKGKLVFVSQAEHRYEPCAGNATGEVKTTLVFTDQRGRWQKKRMTIAKKKLAWPARSRSKVLAKESARQLKAAGKKAAKLPGFSKKLLRTKKSCSGSKCKRHKVVKRRGVYFLKVKAARGKPALIRIRKKTFAALLPYLKPVLKMYQSSFAALLRFGTGWWISSYSRYTTPKRHIWIVTIGDSLSPGTDINVDQSIVVATPR